MKEQRRRDNRAPRLIIINLEVLTPFSPLNPAKRERKIERVWEQKRDTERERYCAKGMKRGVVKRFRESLLLAIQPPFILAVLKLLKCHKDRAFIHKLLASYIIAPMDPKKLPGYNLRDWISPTFLFFVLFFFSLHTSSSSFFFFFWFSPWKQKKAITDSLLQMW